ncbi:MAG: efflux RND transporter periplasmic adaptor subunit [Candidatus Sumerlaeia bacterium]
MTRKFNKSSVILLVAAVLMLFLGLWIGRAMAPERTVPESMEMANDAHDHEEAEATEWTCSMHPQIRQSEPGKCPICFMELIPVVEDAGSEGLGPRQIRMSERARALASIETSPVRREWVDAKIRLTGTVRADETREGHITAWFPGRIERMYINFTGVSVNKGDHMAELYSPEILATQNELILAMRAAENNTRSGMEDLVRSTRERLRLWGLTSDQIDRMAQADDPWESITIYAPMSGIVIEKHVSEGMYLKTGERLYTIADLSKVWLELDAYESDLQWLRYGQDVDFTVDAWPGREFRGMISFIHPTLDMQTRATGVRVVVDNQEGLLKPGMYATSIVHSRVAASGKVIEPKLADKWICPMHPQIIKDTASDCDICGMDLVKAESLGYEPIDPDAKPPLVIPASAVLKTGERAVVYVQMKDEDGVYEGREILLGARAGDYYLVEEGLGEGESVVTRGNFKIDSAMQILAKPSMMSPVSVMGDVMEGGEHEDHAAMRPEPFENVSEEFLKQLDAYYQAYAKVQEALASDNLEAAAQAAGTAIEALKQTDMNLLDEKPHMFWMDELEAIRKALAKIRDEKENIGRARTEFKIVSDATIRVARRLGMADDTTLNLFYCPMAFDNLGAEWLQTNEDLRNPYFGDQMLKCGEMRPLMPTDEKKAE